jgi:hypothetical protein
MKRKLRLALFLSAILLVITGCEGSGDRVLVSKFQTSANLTDPRRYEVVVFKYPRGPVENNVPKNYIKRLLGLPGEILAIFFGRLFHVPAPPPGAPPHFGDINDANVDPLELWTTQYMHVNDDKSKKLFEEGKFEPLRKPLAVLMALRRIVNDNDHQPASLKGKLPPRWNPADASAWKADDADHKVFSHTGAKAERVDWLRYQHLQRDQHNPNPTPSLITDFMGYNAFETQRVSDDPLLPPGPIEARTPSPNWVGDLMLECQVTVDKAEGEFWMELSKGIHRFRARWQLDSGTCTLFRVDYARDKDGEWIKDKNGKLVEKAMVELASQGTRLKNPGSYQLRLCQHRLAPDRVGGSRNALRRRS